LTRCGTSPRIATWSAATPNSPASSLGYKGFGADTGKHKLSVEDRRKNIVKRLLAEEVVGTNLLPGMTPKKVEPSHHARRHKATSRF